MCMSRELQEDETSPSFGTKFLPLILLRCAAFRLPHPVAGVPLAAGEQVSETLILSYPCTVGDVSNFWEALSRLLADIVLVFISTSSACIDSPDLRRPSPERFLVT